MGLIRFWPIKYVITFADEMPNFITHESATWQSCEKICGTRLTPILIKVYINKNQ